MKVYMVNRHKVARHNILYEKGEKSYSLAVNQFGDLVHHILCIFVQNIYNNFVYYPIAPSRVCSPHEWF